MKNIFFAITLLVLAVNTAWAGSITEIYIPGDYYISGANWDDGGVNVVGVNNTNGMNFAVTPSGGYIEYDVPSSLGMLTYGAYGVANGYVAGGGLHESFSGKNTLYSLVTGQWTDIGDHDIFAVGPNGRIGGFKDNNAFAADVDNGKLANITTISPTPPYQGMVTFGISGNVSVGNAYPGDNTSKAFAAEGTVLRPLETGYSSDAYAYDPVTSTVYGGMDGKAVYWTPDGKAHFFADPNGQGWLQGEARSGYGGLSIIRSGGDLFVAYDGGNQVKTLGDYILALGLTIPVTGVPTDAWFIGDGDLMAFIFPGSINISSGTVVDMARAGGFDVSDDNGETAVPEPGTWALAAVGVALLFFRKRQTGAVPRPPADASPLN